MKISELSNNDVLDFLMTSDFNDDYSPDELKYLLVKWRYFYRLSQGMNDQIRTKFEGDIQELEKEIGLHNNTIGYLKSISDEKDELIMSMKSRKLTFKERIKGRIMLTKDENKIL